MEVARLYIISQRDVDLTTLRGWLKAHGIQQWIYFGEDSAWAVKTEVDLAPAVPRVSIADLLEEMSWKIRQPYIDWIGKLSQVNQSLDWWASALAAKNPYHSVYLRVCLLAVARELLVVGFDRPTLVICSCRALSDEMIRLASRMQVKLVQWPNTLGLHSLRGYLAGEYRRMVRWSNRVLRKGPGYWKSGHGYRREVLARKGVRSGGDFCGEGTALLFTWVDRRNFGPNGCYYDPHLGLLGPMLRDRGYRVAYVPRVLPTVPFEEAVDRLLQTRERLFFPEVHISDRDWIHCRRRAWSYEPAVVADLKVADIPVYRLDRDLIDSTRDAVGEILTYECLVANLAAGGVRPAKIIHNCEGHSWEQVLAWSARRYMPNTKVIGYDNGTFSRLVLSMYPASSECAIRPLPDRIVTNGPLYRDILLAENIPSSLVKVGGALRHAYLWDAPVNPPRCESATHHGAIRVLVATPIGFGEAVELVAKAAKAFGGDPCYEIIIKCHPTLDGDRVIRHLGQLARHENLRLVATPVPELFSSVHLMLYTYSVVCYEALQHGVPPVFVKAESFLNLDPLESAPDVRWEATTAEDLRRVAEEITRMTPEERQKWQKRAAEIVRLALAPITPESVDAFLL